MRRVTLIVIAVAVAAVVLGLYLTRPQREWSSDDPAAIEELLQGREALDKLYFPEAVEHARAALAHDSHFVAARLLLGSALYNLDQREAAEREIKEALKADPKKLTPREARALELWRLELAGKHAERLELLKRYAAEAPDDAEIPRQLASNYWREGNADEAAKWAEAALKISPNQAMAYNLLGYIEMSRGNFAAAESSLHKYTFIAPNQANPHDSLGELYTVLGRWDDALAEFNKALAVNPNFFPAYLHIARIAMFRGDEQAALASAKKGWDLTGMSAEDRERESVVMRGLAAWSRRDDAAFLAIMRGSKPSYDNPGWTLAMVTALAEAGETAAAHEVLEHAATLATKHVEWSKGMGEAALLVARARVSLAEGSYDEAVAAAKKADSLLTYSIDDAFLKFSSQCITATALARRGDRAQAAELVAEVAKVNPMLPALARCRQEIGAR